MPLPLQTLGQDGPQVPAIEALAASTDQLVLSTMRGLGIEQAQPGNRLSLYIVQEFFIHVMNQAENKMGI